MLTVKISRPDAEQLLNLLRSAADSYPDVIEELEYALNPGNTSQPEFEEDGHWDGDRFVFDFERIAKQTGYTLKEVQDYGVSYCRRNPRMTKEKAIQNGYTVEDRSYPVDVPFKEVMIRQQGLEDTPGQKTTVVVDPDGPPNSIRIMVKPPKF